jgi:hypothetical protein
MEEMQMGPEEMEAKKKQVMEMCVCGNCPSYKDCSQEGGEKELGFCFPTVGKSKCITEEKGCTCGGCPVTAQMGLKHTYFCTKGSEKEQAEQGGEEPAAEAAPAEAPAAEPAEEKPATETPEEEPPAEEKPAETPPEQPQTV